jgi:hypothetical protein
LFCPCFASTTIAGYRAPLIFRDLDKDSRELDAGYLIEKICLNIRSEPAEIGKALGYFYILKAFLKKSHAEDQAVVRAADVLQKSLRKALTSESLNKQSLLKAFSSLDTYVNSREQAARPLVTAQFLSVISAEVHEGEINIGSETGAWR